MRILTLSLPPLRNAVEEGPDQLFFSSSSSTAGRKLSGRVAFSASLLLFFFFEGSATGKNAVSKESQSGRFFCFPPRLLPVRTLTCTPSSIHRPSLPRVDRTHRSSTSATRYAIEPSRPSCSSVGVATISDPPLSATPLWKSALGFLAIPPLDIFASPGQQHRT